MKYDNTINYLYGLQGAGIKLGLRNIRALLDKLGNPQDTFDCLHIAGTNGKGSTAACLSGLLHGPDHLTGLFTSPHLLSFTERIRVNAVQITEGEVIELADTVREAALGLDPTFFEVVTAMAYLYFKMRQVRWAVIETGLGGRLDSTNTIAPKATIITPIALDHAEFLGHTINSVASEKAGIIKKGVPLVLAAQCEEARKVITGKAAEMDAPLYEEGRDFHFSINERSTNGIIFDYSDSERTIKSITLPLRGDYQAQNAALAIRAFCLTAPEMSPEALESTIKEALSKIHWPGRLERVSETPPVYIDGAHNPSAALALARELTARPVADHLTLVLGVMRDKDVVNIISPLLPLADKIICSSPAYGRAMTSEYLAGLCQRLGHKADSSDNVSDALEAAISTAAASNGAVLVAGSFFTAGEALEALGAKGVLTRLRECASK